MYLLLIAIVVLLLGFYALYSTSQKAMLSQGVVSKWLQRNRNFARVIGIVCLLLAFILLVFAQGVGAGILTGFIFLMTIGCLVILLSPLTSNKN